MQLCSKRLRTYCTKESWKRPARFMINCFLMQNLMLIARPSIISAAPRSTRCNFRPLNALPHYAKAYQYRPDRLDYANEYASTLIGQKEYKKAESVFDNLLSQLRGLATQNPGAYRPDLAMTLTNLGVVYRDTQRFGDAESAYKEALDIQRSLAAQNPAAYRPDLASILTNLGVVLRPDAALRRRGERLQGSLGHPARPCRPEPRRLPA